MKWNEFWINVSEEGGRIIKLRKKGYVCMYVCVKTRNIRKTELIKNKWRISGSSTLIVIAVCYLHTFTGLNGSCVLQHTIIILVSILFLIECVLLLYCQQERIPAFYFILVVFHHFFIVILHCLDILSHFNAALVLAVSY